MVGDYTSLTATGDRRLGMGAPGDGAPGGGGLACWGLDTEAGRCVQPDKPFVEFSF